MTSHKISPQKTRKKQNGKSKNEEAESEECVILKNIGLTYSKWKFGIFPDMWRLTDTDSTWVPEENLDYPDLIEEYFNLWKSDRKKMMMPLTLFGSDVMAGQSR